MPPPNQAGNNRHRLYLSPEQVRGEDVDASSDIYSLGLVLLECLTGKPEYPGSSAESAVARLTRLPQVPSTLPPDWWSFSQR
jgi:eukaryotic-like serine/threonine-protein kinase